jgi:pyruvate kinase
MLSAETARGEYPVEAVRVMATIAREVESAYPHEQLRARRIEHTARSIESSIAQSAARVSEELALPVIVCGTTTGATAANIASFRPRARVLAITPSVNVARRLNIVWGVEARVVPAFQTFEELLSLAEAQLAKADYVVPGLAFALTTGMPVEAGGTNVLKIHRLP